MPLRSYFTPFANIRTLYQQQWHSHFHTTSIRYNKTHYDTLQISYNATPAEVKKSFYALSKAHHPDRNPNDPDASERFVKISNAYTILGTPAKRAAYDRDISQSTSSSPSTPSGSYSSSGPVGSRPPSGLSRRRTQFRGPPASFYRNGAWGEHSAKRAEAQMNGRPARERPDFMNGGMDPGQQPWGQGNDVPHFDKEGHFRTHESIEAERRRHRQVMINRDRERRAAAKGSSFWGQFSLMFGLLFMGIWGPGVVGVFALGNN